MRWALIRAMGLRYTLVFGGGTTAVAYGGATLLGSSPALPGIVLLLLGVGILVSTLTGSSGLGTGATAVEPASGVHIDPADHAMSAGGPFALEGLFYGVGLVLGAVGLFVLAVLG
jgi:hypothetical protein